MTHLEVENLVSEYVEGELEESSRVQFETHLAGCTRCSGLVADVRRLREECRSAEVLEPPPWLIAKMLRATVGVRQPTAFDRLREAVHSVLQPRVAYGMAMAVFSFSLIVNVAGINLRRFNIQDLNPRTWVNRASRNGHLLYARAEKFYYDLRIVYEIESRLRELRRQSGQGDAVPEKEAPANEPAPGGSTDRQQPGNPQLAQAEGLKTLGVLMLQLGGKL